MKSILQKLLCCILAGLILLAAVGCDNKKPAKKPTNSGNNSSSSTIDDEDFDDEFEDEDFEEEEEDEDFDDEDFDDDDFDFDDDLDLEDKENSNKPGNNPSTPTPAPVVDPDEVDENDKPWFANPSGLTHPMTSAYENETKKLRDEIRGMGDKLPASVTGKIWYISNDGDNKNSGTSEKSPLKNIEGLNYYRDSIKAGDAVLFERGDVFRGEFVAKDGVYYGAYGTGDKPCIYGSAHNYAKVTWTKKNNNIWVLDALLDADVGVVVFNHGESVGYKKNKNYLLEKNGDYWCDPSSNYRLYMYMDTNPSKKFKSIEIGLGVDNAAGINHNIIKIPADAHDITIENLCIKYTGAHGIGATADAKNITIRGCEMGYIGGAYISDTLRFGNAIEFFNGCDNIVCEKNWIYEIYDTGITYQGGMREGKPTIFKNINISKNLIERCGLGSIEYWISGVEDDSYAENVTISNNIMRFAGYCWGGDQRPDKVSTHIRSDSTCRNYHINFKMENNIFDQSTGDLVFIGYQTSEKDEVKYPDRLPKMSGNVYAQRTNGSFGNYGKKFALAFDDDLVELVTNFVDATPTIKFY